MSLNTVSNHNILVFFCGKFTLIWLHIKAQVNLIINALKISVLDFFPAIPLY